jgi:L-alanine-DL-glutamate epimerase-like enolase superfamily enzyme
MLEAVRDTIGPGGRIRIDVNEAWGLNQSIRILNDWDSKFGIEFCEAPVSHELPDSMREVRQRVPCEICANEALGREIDVLRIIRSRCADVLCFSPYWVGSLRRMIAMSGIAHLEGLRVCKHTHGELGITAAACQHVLLNIPNADWGNQQTASVVIDDILAEPIPIASGPKWGPIEKPGLGVEVDEDKVAKYHEATLRDGPFTPFRRP